MIIYYRSHFGSRPVGFKRLDLGVAAFPPPSLGHLWRMHPAALQLQGATVARATDGTHVHLPVATWLQLGWQVALAPYGVHGGRGAAGWCGGISRHPRSGQRVVILTEAEAAWFGEVRVPAPAPGPESSGSESVTSLDP